MTNGDNFLFGERESDRRIRKVLMKRKYSVFIPKHSVSARDSQLEITIIFLPPHMPYASVERKSGMSKITGGQDSDLRCHRVLDHAFSSQKICEFTFCPNVSSKDIHEMRSPRLITMKAFFLTDSLLLIKNLDNVN